MGRLAFAHALEGDMLSAVYAQADERNRRAEEASTSHYLARINNYMAITIDHSTYFKAVLSSPGHLDWYIDDLAGTGADIESQKLANNYRHSFVHMLKREHPDFTITHQRLFNGHTGELMTGPGADEDVDYNF